MQRLDVKYNKTSRLRTDVNNLARTLKAKVQQADPQNPQAGKVISSQLLVTDLWKQTGKHRELVGDGSAYLRKI